LPHAKVAKAAEEFTFWIVRYPSRPWRTLRETIGVTLTCYLLPVLLLAYTRQISVSTAQALAGGGVLVPFLLYRPSRSWSLLNYYLFFPTELPANGGASGPE